MRFEREGSFEITRLQERVEDARIALERANARLAPLKAFAARMEAAAEAFFQETKAATAALPKSVGNEILDKEYRRITEVTSNIENLLCEVGLEAFAETEAEVIKPLELAVEVAEKALDVAEREQANIEYYKGVL